MLSMLAPLMAAGMAAGADPLPAWNGPVDVGSVTTSVKWTVHAVPDGDGGAICAWEENRGRKVCCRDTRDVYAQRLDAAGRRIWNPSDVPVAVLDAGEELLGLVPGSGGQALALFRRGNGSLLVSALGGAGSSASAPEARRLESAEGVGEWLPGNGFAPGADGHSAAAIYGLPVEGGMAVRVVVASWSATGWSVSGPVEIGRAMGLHPGAIAWSGDRWFAVTWSETADGIRMAGVWLAPGGLTRSAPIDLGVERGRTYAFLRAVGDGTGGAWVLRAAVNAATYERTHAVTLTSVVRGAREATTVRHASAGTARTSAMFIPSVMVGSSDQSASAATPPTVSWRPTSWVVPAGPGAACVFRVEGDRLLGATVRRAGGRIVPGPAVTIAQGLADAFTPVSWVRSGGGIGMVWGRTTPAGVLLESASCTAGVGPLSRGAVTPLVESRSPRVGVPVTGPGGRTMLVYAEALGSETGAVRAVRFPEGAP